MSFEIGKAPDEAVLAEHWRLHWLEMGSATARPGWDSDFTDFLKTAPGLVIVGAWSGAFPLGSVVGHEIERPFPSFREVDAKKSGYVWSLYVHPDWRGQGVGTQLLNTAFERLKGQGCSAVLLHAGDRSRPLYERLGFRSTNEMSMSL
jgi:ribosomal protein S18 acetylase RimI-like enzyme